MDVSVKIQRCEGYAWESDKTEPLLFFGSICELNRKDSDNPFILEAMLYDLDSQESYTIKYIDGSHRIYKYNLLKEFDAATSVEMLPNRMKGVVALKFKQIWNRQSDELCNGFETLTPAAFAFVGFKKESV
ncbi:TIGR04423 family type III CRISPR-associated protein [uncultured Fibrobacter sp.]|uniref:TIGR04423 family type III CRISPR-associated protein n=1 Tax=uncultured Fibrobacter sp. TaxID=261512 RepID=UPI0025996F3E|nr:TIGR04423 family type III CRISPR-associated protein [uncultured Fibrobacter sp.]